MKNTITVHDLTNAEYKGIINRLPFTRKPGDWEEVTAHYDFDDLPQRMQDTLIFLPQIEIGKADCWEKLFTHEMQFTIGFRGEETYFIDTQGYDYARYVCRLFNFPKDLAENLDDDGWDVGPSFYQH